MGKITKKYRKNAKKQHFRSYRFSSIFSINFGGILVPKTLPKPLPDPFKINKKMI